MRISLQNQPQIEKLAQPLAQSLRNLVAAIQTGWNSQHAGDGSHGDVTATALTVTGGETVLGPLRLSYVTYTEPVTAVGLVHNITVAGLSDVSMLRVVALTNPLRITGIDATGRTPGSLLLVVNADDTTSAPADLDLQMENTGSAATNRFAESAASPTAVGGNVRVQGARGVWLVYDYQRASPSVAGNLRWRVMDPSS